MNDLSHPATEALPAAAALPLELAVLGGRLAALLRRRLSGGAPALALSLEFLDSRYRALCGDTPPEDWEDDCRARIATRPDSPLARAVARLGLGREQVELLLLAGMAEEHEGYAELFRSLHPKGQPRPSVGLAAQLICPDTDGRRRLRRWLQPDALSPFALGCDGGGDPNGDVIAPFFSRSLALKPGIWDWLLQLDAWPPELPLLPLDGEGLEHWLDGLAGTGARLASGGAFTLCLAAETRDAAANRAAALCRSAGLGWAAADLADLDAGRLSLLLLHCRLRGRVPLLLASAPDPAGPAPRDNPSAPPALLRDYPAPLILCADTETDTDAGARPLLSLHCRPLDAPGLRRMWRQLLPEMADSAAQLAARYPFEPFLARRICDDLRLGPELRDATGGAGARWRRIAGAVRARSQGGLGAGIQLLEAGAGWEQLVLPAPQLDQLRDAAGRLLLQPQVLDEWRFLDGRRGARGVRMLFAGPPGTGKTLSAEVMASAMGVDLLQVDLSRVVSKWIGETEKNLARVFAAAESARAVLFFDEADALFGKRTEVSDAHDRYANLETAYLLSRLERYDGLAVLATNYRQNIDSAFSRRLDFIIEFEEPGQRERLRLWQCHIPAGAPLAEDVDLAELAAQFPIVGGHIRNAALGAAFLAAADGGALHKRHFIQAIKREYEKSGRAYREVAV